MLPSLGDSYRCALEDLPYFLRVLNDTSFSSSYFQLTLNYAIVLSFLKEFGPRFYIHGDLRRIEFFVSSKEAFGAGDSSENSLSFLLAIVPYCETPN